MTRPPARGLRCLFLRSDGQPVRKFISDLLYYRSLGYSLRTAWRLARVTL